MGAVTQPTSKDTNNWPSSLPATAMEDEGLHSGKGSSDHGKVSTYDGFWPADICGPEPPQGAFLFQRRTIVPNNLGTHYN